MEKIPFVESVTLSIVSLFWIFQVLVAVLGGVPSLFAVTSPDPSIGWIFSSVSHTDLAHILMNSAGMLVLGSTAEKYIKTEYYISAFFSIAIVSNVLEWVYRASIYSAEPVLGASGAVYAFAGFYFIYAVKENMLSLNELPQKRIEFVKYLMTSHWLVWLISGVSAVALVTLIAELTGIIQPSGNARMAHGAGVILGFVLAFLVESTNDGQVPNNRSQNTLI